MFFFLSLSLSLSLSVVLKLIQKLYKVKGRRLEQKLNLSTISELDLWPILGINILRS